MKPAIRVVNLSKQYRLGERSRESYRTLREAITDTVGAPFRRLYRSWQGQTNGREEADTLWALKDVSFEVQPGEVVGIIGRNGAGKSTLLKILSRIVEPTSGHAEIHGRMGSLLEVGTGFHPELTGRENIYLNGSILGMSRREIQRKFDEIVAFSEIEKFLDTPVKRYSSGMYVRLAFAVAAHLEPEILVVDEVLAVGDIEFQKKCLGKLKAVAESGRTIIFVSHNLAAIQNICSIGILLSTGRMVKTAVIGDVIKAYLEIYKQFSGERMLLPLCNSPNHKLSILKIAIEDLLGSTTPVFPMGSGMRIRTIISSSNHNSNLALAIGIYNIRRERIATIHSLDTNLFQFTAENHSQIEVICVIQQLFLMPGDYSIDLMIQQPPAREALIHLVDAINFKIEPTDVFNTGRIPSGQSLIYIPCQWETS